MDVYLSVTVRTSHHVTHRPGHVMMKAALILPPRPPVYVIIDGKDLDVK